MIIKELSGSLPSSCPAVMEMEGGSQETGKEAAALDKLCAFCFSIAGPALLRNDEMQAHLPIRSLSNRLGTSTEAFIELG